jgi:methionine sulfoxide reductase heme-binding subunit
MITRLLGSWNIVRTVLFITIFSSLLYFLLEGFNETTLRTAVRLTARMSGLLFSLAFVSSFLFALLKNDFTKWLSKNRKYIGVSFALVHLIHLGFIISLQVIFKTVIPGTKLFTIVGGGIAYGFVIAMLLTSFDRFADYLSKKQWKRLHSIGAYWIWMVFLFSYLKRIKADYLYLALALFYITILVVRLYGKRVRKTRIATV